MQAQCRAPGARQATAAPRRGPVAASRSSGAAAGRRRAAAPPLAACLPPHSDGSSDPHHHSRRQHPSAQAAALYGLLHQAPVVGSEHGEGFMHLLGRSGAPCRVDVDTLNDSMRPSGALRLRHAQHPHEAFGLVFNFDSVVADVGGITREAWRLLAEQRGLPLHPRLLASPELVSTPPEVAAVRLLRWAGDRRAGSELALQHAAIAGELLINHNRPQEGVREWLDALGRFNVPCALVSALDKSTVQGTLARMTLHDHFSTMVTQEDEADTIAQRLLAAAIKLGRPPNMCVYFDVSPAGITAAHNVTFKAVAVQGAYHPHQLKAADITCSSLGALSVINVRRLFANMGSELMDLQKQAAGDSTDDGRPRARRNVTNALL